jgi:hypothetical protein
MYGLLENEKKDIPCLQLSANRHDLAKRGGQRFL